MQRIKNLIKHMDRDPYTIQISYKNRTDFKSCTGGFISLLFYLASAAVLISNTYYLLSQDQLIYTLQQLKNNYSEIYLDRNNISLLIVGIDENNQRFNITPQNQEEYGLRVMVNQTTSFTEPLTFNTKATNCSSESFFNSSEFFCFPEKFPMFISGRSDVVLSDDNKNYSKLTFVVQNITKNLTNITKLIRIEVSLYYINNVLSPKNISGVIGKKVRLFKVNDGEQLNYQSWHKLSLFFKNLNITTDTDQFFLNSYEYKNYTYYDEEWISSVLPFEQGEESDKNWLAEIKLKRSLYTLKYNRYYKKVYTYLAESFGVIGLVSFVFLLYRGYNKWRFTELELMSPPVQRTNLLRYYQYKIKQFKKKLVLEHSKIQSEFEHSMDIFKMLDKMDDFQKRLRELEKRSTLTPDLQRVLMMKQSQQSQRSFTRTPPNARWNKNKNDLDQKLLNQTEVRLSEEQKSK